MNQLVYNNMRDFINENSISFEPGSRNSSIVTLIGYAQHLGLSQSALEEELADQIAEDSFIQEEIDRLWDYCKVKNYKNYWSSKEAGEQYTF